MQDQSQSVYKTLAWLLLLVVIGLYALFVWYSGTLKEALSAQQARVSEGTVQLQEARRTLDQAERAQRGLHEEIDRLQESHGQTVKGLKEQLGAATQANAALKADLEDLRRRDAETLAAEQRKAADAHAELQARLDAAADKIASLGAEIEGLQQAQREAAARHDAQLAAAEQRYQTRLSEAENEAKERTAALRTALEGSDPDRAALFAGFEQRIESARATIASLEDARDGLTGQLADTKQALAETSQSLTDTQRSLAQAQADLTQTRGELAQLEARYDTAMDKAAMEQAALQTKLDAAIERAAKERAELEAQRVAAQEQAAKERATLQGKFNADLAKAEQARVKLQGDHQAELERLTNSHTEQMREAEGRIATLSASLASEQSALAALRTEHDATMSRLAKTDQDLKDLRAELSAAVEAAARQKANLEQQITEAKGQVARLEDTLAAERQAGQAARQADQQAHAQAMAHQHDLLLRLAEIGGRETAQGMLVLLSEADLKFPISKATLPAGQLPSLDRIAAFLAEYPTMTARIEGHTDAAGREETNLALSQARADAVKQALVGRGVAAERLEAVGLGESRPIADNATKAGSRQNRRIEVYIRDAAP